MEDDPEQLRRLIAAGYCPVECSVGGESLVDALEMDHHGPRSHLESVALRAYRDHFGARRLDPRFVGTGAADADMTFAIAALAGLLPHPSTAAPLVWQRDLTPLAHLIAVQDTAPIGFDLLAHPWADPYLLWRALTGERHSMSRPEGAVWWWTTLLTLPSGELHALALPLRNVEMERRQLAAAALVEGRRYGAVLLLTTGLSWGFDVWYGRRVDHADPADPAAWEHPVVLVHHAKAQQATLGCPNVAVAEALFGAGGLLNIFPKLEPQGWGGRQAIGGSPRGLLLRPEEVEAVAVQLAAWVAAGV